MRMPLVINILGTFSVQLSPSLVKACLKKAQYLLKFAGLSKVQQDSKISSPLVRPAWATKGKQWQKVPTAVNTVGILKQQVMEMTLWQTTTTMSTSLLSSVGEGWGW